MTVFMPSAPWSFVLYVLLSLVGNLIEEIGISFYDYVPLEVGKYKFPAGLSHAVCDIFVTDVVVDTSFEFVVVLEVESRVGFLSEASRDVAVGVDKGGTLAEPALHDDK